MAAVSAAFGDLLRSAGIPVTTEQLGRFVRAIELSRPVSLAELWLIGRVTLVSDRSFLDTYDRAFDQVFRGIVDWADQRGQQPPVSPVSPSRPRSRRDSPIARRVGGADAGGTFRSGPGLEPRGSESDRQVEIDLALASGYERLATTDFSLLSPDELGQLASVMQQIRLAVPLRRARRHRRRRHGDRLDMRATLRRSRRTGGDPIAAVTRRAAARPRRLVVLCDISGSMAPYSRACIQLLHAAAGGSRAEVFTFATRLTRLTKSLAVSDADAALAAAAAAAPDWNGGTRLGTALKAFIDRYGRPGLARGAVLVIVSDGWDNDDPSLVGEQMSRLSRMAHRIVWVNPRRAAEGYQPLAGAMAAALPYCDAFVSGHSLVALGQAMSSLADDGGRHGPTRWSPQSRRSHQSPAAQARPPSRATS